MKKFANFNQLILSLIAIFISIYYSSFLSAQENKSRDVTNKFTILENICKKNGKHEDCTGTIINRMREVFIRGEGRSISKEDFERLSSDIDFISKGVSWNNTPTLICNQLITGSIYCMRTNELYSLYSKDHILKLDQEFRDWADKFNQNLRDSGFIVCSDGSQMKFALDNMPESAFRLNGSTEASHIPHQQGKDGGASDTDRPKRPDDDSIQPPWLRDNELPWTPNRPNFKHAGDIFEAELGKELKKLCRDNKGPSAGGGFPPGGADTAFDLCMAQRQSLNFSPISDALAYAEQAKACLEGTAYSTLFENPWGNPPEDNPFAQAVQNIANYMSGAANRKSTGETAKVRLTERGGLFIRVTANKNGEDYTIGIGPNFDKIRITGAGLDYRSDVSDVPEGNHPVKGVVTDGKNAASVIFKDNSSVQVDKNKNEVDRYKPGGPIQSSGTLDPPEDPPEDPKDTSPAGSPTKKTNDIRCPPEDTACDTCKIEVESASAAVEACIAGAGSCKALIDTLTCCEDPIPDDQGPLVQPVNGDVASMCKGYANQEHDSWLDCVERCSRFQGFDCMDWCLNRQKTVSEAILGAFNNICWYIEGLECPDIGGPELVVNEDGVIDLQGDPDSSPLTIGGAEIKEINKSLVEPDPEAFGELIRNSPLP